MKILFVCSGNICRSPAARDLLERVLAERSLPAVEVDSAGTLGIVGEPAAPLMISALGKDRGRIRKHLSKGISADLIGEATIVLAMEKAHLASIARVAPDHPGVELLGSYLPSEKRKALGGEIPDPIGGGPEDFEGCVALMREAVERFVDVHLALSKRPSFDQRDRGAGEDEAEKIYFGSIAARVDSARGKQTGLNSMEFHLADGWWKSGLPLWQVLEAMDSVAARWKEGEAPRSYMGAVAASLRESAEGESSGLAETGSRRPGPDPMELLIDEWSRAAERHRGSATLSGALDQAVRDLKSAKSRGEEPAGAARRVRRQVDEAAREFVGSDRIDIWRREEELRLRGLAAPLAAAVFDETLDRMVRRRLFRHLELPEAD